MLGWTSRNKFSQLGSAHTVVYPGPSLSRIALSELPSPSRRKPNFVGLCGEHFTVNKLVEGCIIDQSHWSQTEIDDACRAIPLGRDQVVHAIPGGKDTMHWRRSKITIR
jgi:hypothetical protein